MPVRFFGIRGQLFRGKGSGTDAYGLIWLAGKLRPRFSGRIATKSKSNGEIVANFGKKRKLTAQT